MKLFLIMAMAGLAALLLYQVSSIVNEQRSLFQQVFGAISADLDPSTTSTADSNEGVVAVSDAAAEVDAQGDDSDAKPKESLTSNDESNEEKTIIIDHTHPPTNSSVEGAQQQKKKEALERVTKLKLRLEEHGKNQQQQETGRLEERLSKNRNSELEGMLSGETIKAKDEHNNGTVQKVVSANHNETHRKPFHNETKTNTHRTQSGNITQTPLIDKQVREKVPLQAADKIGQDTSCRRHCPQRINKIYYEHRAAGISDRYSIISALSNIAGYLCAVVEMPPPRYSLSHVHNNMQEVNQKVLWTDFRNWTFLEDNSPAVKDALIASRFPEGFNHDDNWRRAPVFPTDEYPGWFRVSTSDPPTRQENILEHYKKLQDYSWLQKANATEGFIWDIHKSWYNDNDLRTSSALPEPSKEVLNMVSNYKSEMSPKSCSYVHNDVPRPLAVLQEQLRERVWSLAPQNTSIYGFFHVRRGDAKRECDNSLEALHDYLRCSLNGTESTGRRITLMLGSDEKDDTFRQNIIRLVSNLANVSMLDADNITSEMIQEMIQKGLMPSHLENNYYQYELMGTLRTIGRSNVELIRRRSTCPACTPLLKAYPSVWN